MVEWEVGKGMITAYCTKIYLLRALIKRRESDWKILLFNNFFFSGIVTDISLIKTKHSNGPDICQIAGIFPLSRNVPTPLKFLGNVTRGRRVRLLTYARYELSSFRTCFPPLYTYIQSALYVPIHMHNDVKTNRDSSARFLDVNVNIFSKMLDIPASVCVFISCFVFRCNDYSDSQFFYWFFEISVFSEQRKYCSL